MASASALPGLEQSVQQAAVSASVDGWRGGRCVHEDGGVYAVYEYCKQVGLRGAFVGCRLLDCQYCYILVFV